MDAPKAGRRTHAERHTNRPADGYEEAHYTCNMCNILPVASIKSLLSFGVVVAYAPFEIRNDRLAR